MLYKQVVKGRLDDRWIKRFIGFNCGQGKVCLGKKAAVKYTRSVFVFNKQVQFINKKNKKVSPRNTAQVMRKITKIILHITPEPAEKELHEARMQFVQN